MLKKTLGIALAVLFMNLGFISNLYGQDTQNKNITIKKFTFDSKPDSRTTNLKVLQDNKTSHQFEFKNSILFSLRPSDNDTQTFTTFLELKSPSTVENVKIHLNKRVDWGILLPKGCVVKASSNGVNWDELEILQSEAVSENEYIVKATSEKQHKSKIYNLVKFTLLFKVKPNTYAQFFAINEIIVNGAKAANAKAFTFVTNLVPNGSFEINDVENVPNIWTYWYDYKYYDTPSVYSDDSTAHDGKYSLCIDTTKFKKDFVSGNPRMRQYRVQHTKPGQEHILSFYAKANQNGTTLKVSLSGSKYFSLTTEWKRYFITKKIKGVTTDIYFQLGQTSSGKYPHGLKVWIDAVQLEPGTKAHKYSESFMSTTAIETLEADVALPELNVEKLPSSVNPKLEVDAVFKQLNNEKPQISKLHHIGKAVLDKNATKVYLFYDKRNFYIFAKAYYPAGHKIKDDATEHDGAVYSDDALEVFIQPNANKKEYVHVAVNARGTIFDQRLKYGGVENNDINWNNPFKVTTKKENRAWLLKMVIPIKWLDNFVKEGDIRFNIGRDGATTWAPIKKRFHEPKHFGILTGLDFLKKKSLISFGKLKINYQLKKKTNILYIPIKNSSKKSVNIELAVKINTISTEGLNNGTEVKFSKKINLNIAGGASKVVQCPIPEKLKFWKSIDIFASKDGRNVGTISEYTLEPPTINILIDDFAFKGEKIPFVLKNNCDPKNVKYQVTVRDSNGSTVYDQTFTHSRDKILNMGPFKKGQYTVRVELKSNNSIFKEKVIKVLPVAKHYTKVDRIYKSINFSGKRKLILAPFFTSLKGLDHLQENGTNAIFYRQLSKEIDYKKMLTFLDRAAQNNIHVFIATTGFIHHYGNDVDGFIKKLQAIIAKVKHHPAYSGLYLADEPRSDVWRNKGEIFTEASLIKVVKTLKETDPLHIYFYVNCGTMKYNWGFGVEDVVFYDRYATVTSSKSRNMKDNYEYAVNAYKSADFFNRPMWRCIAGDSGALPNGVRIPTYDEWKNLVFSTLTSGGTAVWMFAGLPPFERIRERYMPINKQFIKVSKYFAQSMDTDKIKPLFDNSAIVYKAVDYKGAIILLIVNLDYKYNSGSFAVDKEFNNINDLSLKDSNQSKIEFSSGKVSFKLKPYGVIIVELTP